jgi:glyoxylase I family protein
VALYVDDLDAAIEVLHDNDIEVLGTPTASKGPHEGQRWIYFRAPWGMQFELVSYPGGKAFDRQRSAAQS